MSGGAIIEANRAVVLAALQITAELFDARTEADATDESVRALSEHIRPLLPPNKRKSGTFSAGN